MQSGVTLLQSPSGSGKTLIPGADAGGVAGCLAPPCRVVLARVLCRLVAQPKGALVDQCESLRARDVAFDREPTGTRDGDVFIQTWGARTGQLLARPLLREALD